MHSIQYTSTLSLITCIYLTFNNITAEYFHIVCLFVLGFTSRFFTHMETSPLPVKGLKFWPILRTLPLSREGSLACHTYCINRASIYNGHFWGSVTLTPVPVVWHWSCHFLFLRLRSVAAGIQTPNLLHATWAIVKILSNNKLKNHKKF